MSLDQTGAASADQEIPDRQTAAAAKWLSEQGIELDTPTFWLVAGLIGNASSLARKQEREANCKAVCYFCVGDPWSAAQYVNGAWIHTCSFGPDRTVPCNAAAIHERGRKVEG